MLVSALKEISANEARVALTPQSAHRFAALGLKLKVETAAGLAAGFADEDYAAAGVEIAPNAMAAAKEANLVLKVRAPLVSEDKLFHYGQTLLADFQNTAIQRRQTIAALGITCFDLTRIPRISRAQSMDVLSSQTNLAGYKAVLEAFNLLPQTAPLLMTAAGTLAPARVLVLGVGVAGLQAIATAKRLGALVYAHDIRPEVKEQIQSLGARFVDAADQNSLAQRLSQTDVLITTALTSGKPAPKLVSATLLQTMPRGSVAVDLAAADGGNIEGTRAGRLTDINGVRVLGADNLAAAVPKSASLLLADNFYNFLAGQWNAEQREFRFNFDDDLVRQTCLAQNGRLLSREK